MKVRFTSLILIFSIFVACKKTDKVAQEIAKTPVQIDFKYFHKAFFKAELNQLSQVQIDYPYMFTPQMTDIIILNRRQDSLQNALFQKIEKVFGDFKVQEQEIKSLMQHFKYYFPKFKTPMVITDITNLSYDDRVLYANNKLLLSLDMYLGAHENRIYSGYSKYQSQNFIPAYVVIDAAKKMISSQYSYSRDRTFLGKMIYEGKKLYLLDRLLPQKSMQLKMGYSAKKMDWAIANEGQTWAYFIKNKLLYSTAAKLNQRFLDVAPFSKYYLPIDNQTAGYMGRFVGYKIVESYMNHHDISMIDLMYLDAQTLFNDSKYKPKK